MKPSTLCFLLFIVGCSSPGPRFQNVRNYSDGLAAVQMPTGKWGYINGRQDWVIPARYDDAQEFRSGRAAIKLNGKWGFINKRGEWL